TAPPVSASMSCVWASSSICVLNTTLTMMAITGTMPPHTPRLVYHGLLSIAGLLVVLVAGVLRLGRVRRRAVRDGWHAQRRVVCHRGEPGVDRVQPRHDGRERRLNLPVRVHLLGSFEVGDAAFD